MAKAPTRRPPTYSGRRRPPRGPRHVARPIRDRLKTAADLLSQDGHEDAAADVRAVLAPGGWALLRQTGTGAGSQGTNLAVQMGMDLKRALEAAAEEFGVSLSSVAAEGLRAAARGDFIPPRPYGGTGQKTNLNVRIPDDVKAAAQRVLPKLSAQAEYKVSLGNIVMSWLADDLGVDRPVGSDAQTLKMIADKSFLDYASQQGDALVVDLRQVLEEGIRELLAGAYMPPFPQFEERPRDASGRWAADPSRGPREPVVKSSLSVRIDPELLSGLRGKAAELAEESRKPFHAGMIGVAILRDRLGEPAEK